MTKNLRFLHSLIVVILAGCFMTSCFDNEEIDASNYNDLIISNISFGTLPRVMHTKAKDGSDSTYTTTFNAKTDYPFTIDHFSNTAYNVDSLPYGIKADKIVFSAFTIADGNMALRTLNNDKDTLYAVADTVDFSQGYRLFNLFGVDGTSKRQYRVEVRIHKQKADSLTWSQYTVDEFASRKPVAKLPANEFEALDHHFSVIEDAIYDSLSADEEPVAEELDDKAENLPNANFAWITLPSRAYDYIHEVILYGTRNVEGKDYAKLWRRNIDTTGAHRYIWEYLPSTVENYNPLPTLHDASLYVYDEGLLLVGLNTDGKIVVKYSAEHGRTWKNHSVLVLPSSLKDRSASSLESFIDADSNLWLLIDGNEVWRGRAHSVGWNKEQTIFNK